MDNDQNNAISSVSFENGILKKYGRCITSIDSFRNIEIEKYTAAACCYEKVSTAFVWPCK